MNKILYPLGFLIVALAFGACQESNEAMASQLETDIAKWEAELPDYEATGEQLKTLMADLEMAPESFQLDSAGGYPAFHYEMEIYVRNIETTKKEFNRQLGKVKALLEAYRKGEIKQEEFERRYSQYNRSINRFVDYFKNTPVIYESSLNRYNEMKKAWANQ